MDTLVMTYVIYTSAAIALTGILAKTLFHNGKVFLAEVFEDNEALATAVNTLLVTGFYMLNLGYAFLIFRADEAASNIAAIENLVMKLGALLVSLCVIHFVNMGVFLKIRRNAVAANTVPATYTTMVPPPPPPREYAAPTSF